MPDSPSPWRAGLLVSAACVALGVVAYGPAIFGNYGRLEDYSYVVGSRAGDLDYLRRSGSTADALYPFSS